MPGEDVPVGGFNNVPLNFVILNCDRNEKLILFVLFLLGAPEPPEPPRQCVTEQVSIPQRSARDRRYTTLTEVPLPAAESAISSTRDRTCAIAFTSDLCKRCFEKMKPNLPEVLEMIGMFTF